MLADVVSAYMDPTLEHDGEPCLSIKIIHYEIMGRQITAWLETSACQGAKASYPVGQLLLSLAAFRTSSSGALLKSFPADPIDCSTASDDKQVSVSAQTITGNAPTSHRNCILDIDTVATFNLAVCSVDVAHCSVTGDASTVGKEAGGHADSKVDDGLSRKVTDVFTAGTFSTNMLVQYIGKYDEYEYDC